MPSSKQDHSFVQEMESVTSAIVQIESSALDRAISWIQSNLEPSDVFEIKDLESWAEANGYTKE